MTEIPSFYCTKTLLSYHPSPDLNRITLHGPDGFEFALYRMGEGREAGANDRCNALAHRLTELWDGQKKGII
jgi:hypothetical protein